MTATPLNVFNFKIEFFVVGGENGGNPVALCSGAFSECSGLEATMEPKVIREGGHNNGEHQRIGQITYATVILKRGITKSQHLWNWFKLIAEGKSATRLDAQLVQLEMVRSGEGGTGDFESRELLRWKMRNAIPVKFKAATYSASASEVGVEELHFVHEGLSFEPGSGSTA